MNSSITSIIDSLPLKPRVTTNRAPTSGTQADKYQVCSNDLAELQNLMSEAQKAYTAFKAEIFNVRKVNQEAIAFNPTSTTIQYIKGRIDAAVVAADRIMVEIAKVLDPTKIEYIKMVYATSSNGDYSNASAAFKTFEKRLLEIEAEGAKIKKSNQPTTTNTTISDKQTSNIKLDSKVLSKIVYDVELYMILPGSEKITMEQYIGEMMFSRDFDDSALPIYSVIMKVPQNIMYSIKEHFENTKWFITFRARTRTVDKTTETFSFSEVVIDNSELTAIDPVYNPPEDTKSRSDGAGSLPIYPIKMDFIPTKDTKLNATVKANVYTNVRLIDIISILCEELKKSYAATSPSTANEVKFTIAPPDNNKTYEQILVEPGTFTEVINRLQVKYGIYMTGVRVSFDSVQPQRDIKTGKTTNVTHVTVLGKGDTAPVPDAINGITVEVIDPKSLELPAYDSGYVIEKEQNVMIVRTYLPYAVIRRNSEGMVKGESVRVMQNSVEDSVISECDNSTSDMNTQKIYWSNYDNPYALTQMQDSIKEKALEIQTEVRDVNIFAFTDNMSYRLKFYSKDDGLYSGDYRLKALRFYIQNKQSSPMKGVESAGVLLFTNIPPLRVGGTDVARQTYGEKIGTMPGASTGAGYAKLSGAGFGNSAGFSTATKAPFKTNFQGKKDLYGVDVPALIPDDFKMSSTVTFRNVYACKDGIDYNKASGLASNFTNFINCQRYSKEILDVLNSAFSKFGIGVLNSFYRYGVPAGGSKTSGHLVAMATDAIWGGATGDPLADAFYKIIKMNLDFDQIILEGNGSEWRWIHVGKQMNGVNRRQIKIAINSLAGQYKTVNVAKLTSGNDLYWANFRRFVF